MKKHTLLKWLLLPLTVCLAMALAELPDQLYLFHLAPESQGDILYTPTADSSAFQPADGIDSHSVELEASSSAVILLNGGYVNDMVVFSAAQGTQPYRVSALLDDGTTLTIDSQILGLLGQDTLHIGKDVRELSLTATEVELSVNGVLVRNSMRLNWNRMLLVGLMTACVYLLIALRGLVGKRAEYGFLIVALTVGLYIAVGVPLNTSVSYDDQTHYKRTQLLSHGFEGTVNSATLALVDMDYRAILTAKANNSLFYNHNDNAYIKYLDSQFDSATDTSVQDFQYRFSDVGYIPMALGYGLAREAGLPFHLQFTLGRICNMLAYVLLTFAGIRLLKRYKLIFSAIALMPTLMYLSGNYSYDPMINGLCFFGTAMVLDAMMDRSTSLTPLRGLSILLTLSMGSIVKVVYAPLLLLTLLLPRSKFATNGQRVCYKLLAVLVCVIAVGGMLLSAANDVTVLEDDRVAGVDSMGQLNYILHNLPAYLGMFFTSIFVNFQDFFLDSCRVSLSYLGSVEGTLSFLSMVLILLTIFIDSDAGTTPHINWKQRLYFCLITLMIVGAIHTSMYVAYAPVGSPIFSGLQGRYFAPILPLLYVCANPVGIRNCMNKTVWHLSFYLCNALILGTISWQFIATPYFL